MGSFGEATQWHGMRQFRLRGLQKVNTEGLLIAAGCSPRGLIPWGNESVLADPTTEVFL